MTIIWYLLAYFSGIISAAMYMHFMDIHNNLDYNIDAALRRQFEVGYWTRAIEEVDCESE